MPLVETEDRGAVRHIVMTRAEKRNAMNGELVIALGEAFKEAANDDSVRVVVVRGDGPMFSSGMDLGNLNDLAGQAHMLRPFRAECIEANEFPEISQRYQVMAVPKVVINDRVEFEGAFPEPEFLKAVLQAADGKEA